MLKLLHYIFVVFLISLVSANQLQCDSTEGNECAADNEIRGDNRKSPRVISQEELARNTGSGESSRIWMSIFGEVFDVTEGVGYYGHNGSYEVFAGRDATPCFTTGMFNKTGAEADIDTIPNKDLVTIEEWKNFYAESEKYFRVGVLEGVYYDANGEPTPKLKETMERLELGKIEAARIRKERAAIRAQKLKDREAKRKAQGNAF